MSESRPARLPFAVSHYACPPEWSLLRFLDEVTRRGFSGVGLTERALAEMPADAIRRELADRELAVSSLNSAGFFTGTGEARAWQDQRNRDLLSWSVELDGAPLNLIVGGTGDLAPAQARGIVTDALGPFVAEADRLGVPLMLEPLHPLRIRDKSCLNTLADYERMRSRFPSLRLTVDLFHAWWDPDLERIFHDHGPHIGVLQICDVMEEGGIPRRVPLGEGFLDWRAVLRQARRFCPGVLVELEIFADQLEGREMAEILDSAGRTLASPEPNVAG